MILQRQRAMETKYRSKLDALLGTLRTVDSAKDDTTRLQAAEKELTRLKGMRHHPARRPFDPNDLPNQTRRPNKHNRPKTRKRQFITAGLTNNPLPMYASLGNYDYSSLAGASNPAYLAADSEVTLSPAIKAEAAALDNNPVKIYNWVHNNVQWIPSWGAMQDADTTLGSLRGNAFDISALTIALLRASGIPARFVHGTIDVPAAQFMNWAGGFSSITAAANYASSGGIPITPIVEGGQIAMVRMEHIWVEAAIDYYPSRGAVMHSANAWVAMDPSFKQYQYKQGLDIATITGLDPKTLGTTLDQSGTVNSTDGWMQGLDPTILQNAEATAQQKLQTYITNSMTNPTVGDVLGGRTIIQQNLPTLPSSLPNHIVVIGARYASVPNSLRETMTFAFGTDILGDMVSPITLPFSELNNHEVTLSFSFATVGDETALKDLLPTGSITDISQLPTSVPAYLINVVPELKVDGKVMLTGSPINLGEEQDFEFKFAGPGETDTKLYQKNVVAGSCLALMTVAGSVSINKLADLQSQVGATAAVLQSGDPTQLSALSGNDILGELFCSGVLSYYAEYQMMSHIVALLDKVHTQLMPSAGTYGYIPKVNYLVGIPISITAGGVEMDLDRVLNADSTNGNGLDTTKDINFQLGAIESSLESSIPEQMFVTSQNTVEAISAIKALQIAAEQGQRIYDITSANMDSALPNLHLDSSTMNDIRNALNSGKEVITHTDDILVPGWTGAGYVIIDQTTNASAWKIGGGLNGGILVALKYVLYVLAAFYLFINALAKVLGPAIPELQAVARLLQLAMVVRNIFASGLSCLSDVQLIIYTVTFFSLFTIGLSGFVGYMINPLVGFALGVFLQQVSNHLESVIEENKICS